jgi:hypothetical protein
VKQFFFCQDADLPFFKPQMLILMSVVSWVAQSQVAAQLAPSIDRRKLTVILLSKKAVIAQESSHCTLKYEDNTLGRSHI